MHQVTNFESHNSTISFYLSPELERKWRISELQLVLRLLQNPDCPSKTPQISFPGELSAILPSSVPVKSKENGVVYGFLCCFLLASGNNSNLYKYTHTYHICVCVCGVVYPANIAHSCVFFFSGDIHLFHLWNDCHCKVIELISGVILVDYLVQMKLQVVISEEYCAMYDVCGKRSDGVVLNCAYGSPSVEVSRLVLVNWISVTYLYGFNYYMHIWSFSLSMP